MFFVCTAATPSLSLSLSPVCRSHSTFNLIFHLRDFYSSFQLGHTLNYTKISFTLCMPSEWEPWTARKMCDVEQKESVDFSIDFFIAYYSHGRRTGHFLWEPHKAMLDAFLLNGDCLCKSQHRFQYRRMHILSPSTGTSSSLLHPNYWDSKTWNNKLPWQCSFLCSVYRPFHTFHNFRSSFWLSRINSFLLLLAQVHTHCYFLYSRSVVIMQRVPMFQSFAMSLSITHLLCDTFIGSIFAIAAFLNRPTTHNNYYTIFCACKEKIKTKPNTLSSPEPITNWSLEHVLHRSRPTTYVLVRKCAHFSIHASVW